MSQKLDKAEWRPFLELLSKALLGTRAEIEVASLRLGDQMAAEWAPLLGLRYDPKQDAIEVILDGLNHAIKKPREFYYDVVGDLWAALEIVDADDVRHIIQLREPLMLPPPQSSGGTSQ
jgi:hypothetical protein